MEVSTGQCFKTAVRVPGSLAVAAALHAHQSAWIGRMKSPPSNMPSKGRGRLQYMPCRAFQNTAMSTLWWVASFVAPSAQLCLAASIADDLEKISELWRAGALSEIEFLDAKAIILGHHPPGDSSLRGSFNSYNTDDTDGLSTTELTDMLSDESDVRVHRADADWHLVCSNNNAARVRGSGRDMSKMLSPSADR
eukprot:SAG11_NODE_938_length_6471_cov_4.156780_9_plen_194_part_00